MNVSGVVAAKRPSHWIVYAAGWRGSARGAGTKEQQEEAVPSMHLVQKRCVPSNPKLFSRILPL